MSERERVTCELCGLLKDPVDHDGHGLGECVKVCETCGGAGTVPMPHYDFVTHEMALDAGDPQYEGQQIQTGVEDVTCPDCNGLGGIRFEDDTPARDESGIADRAALPDRSED
jgi:DnaJ-class molecular chaperone